MAEMAEKFVMKEGKAVTLYLEPWQKRMLADYGKSLKIKVGEKITIDFKKPVHLNSYRVIFTDPREDGFEIYFTDAQRAYLQDATGLKAVDSMHISKAMIDAQTLVIH